MRKSIARQITVRRCVLDDLVDKASDNKAAGAQYITDPTKWGQEVEFVTPPT